MTEKLTGRTRYRTNWRRKLILQIEVIETSIYTQPETCDSHTSQHIVWRDARVEDLPIPATLGRDTLPK
ncbi:MULTISPECIES: hypothetical protein [unclassified Rhizobium]|uniref:hypothetical protein n=1 Tax=unclassified Rhizobium TaxID=2613769 RepID=UPI001AE19EC5|nr:MULTISPECIES: hypothetical protein [unclassified Rhizobium]MBP2463915.1 hypothetical protein [Rhizobium sp. PvP014]MBP2532281.1 hypothetical protein [Rhizobium sp. PvP099]